MTETIRHPGVRAERYVSEDHEKMLINENIGGEKKNESYLSTLHTKKETIFVGEKTKTKLRKGEMFRFNEKRIEMGENVLGGEEKIFFVAVAYERCDVKNWSRSSISSAG